MIKYALMVTQWLTFRKSIMSAISAGITTVYAAEENMKISDYLTIEDLCKVNISKSIACRKHLSFFDVGNIIETEELLTVVILVCSE